MKSNKKIIEIFKDITNENFTKYIYNKSIMYKNLGFKSENEYRFWFDIDVKNDEAIYSNIQFNYDISIDGKIAQQCFTNKYYYDIPLKLSLIKKIIIGPKEFYSIQNREEKKTFIYEFIKANCDNKSEMIKKKNIILTKLTYR